MASVPKPMRDLVTDYIAQLQETIVIKLETYGSGLKFRREAWTREGGGGGLSYTFPPLNASPIDDNHPIEKAEVNISMIYGILPPTAVKQMSTAHAALRDIDKSLPFFAAGLSSIIHPRHPRVPGVHATYRYFEVLNAPLPLHDPATSVSTPSDDPKHQPTVLAWWFGVITDLTPAYVNGLDFRHFHTTLKTGCDARGDAVHTVISISVYPAFKASCDDYLFIPHRHEHRGIGEFGSMTWILMRCALLRRVAGGTALPEETIECLTVICNNLERRMHGPTVPSERRWQLIRRGRAVKFNFVVDRGTRSGLAVLDIRAENVLMRMPPEARCEYCCELGSEDQDTEEVQSLKQPKSWME